MRSIINISLPKETARIAKMRAEKAGFSSMSEYIRSLLSMDSDLISVKELLKISKNADREYKSGSLKKYKSLSSLLKAK